MRISITALVAIAALVGVGRAQATVNYSISPVTDVSNCSGQNAEVEQAVDQTLGYVYEDWIGCSGIAFARSTDGGLTFSKPVSLPGSLGGINAWDPAVAVAPDGTVYAAFMRSHDNQWYPVVDASFDHGQTFPQETLLTPPDAKNWGDRDFIAVAPDGTVYVTWDYGPNRTSITFLCAANGSCGYATGDVNEVMQRSTDGGRTFGPMTYISPGFPASGGDSGPLVVEPNGRIDVLYQDYKITDTTTYAMAPGVSYFTSSTDGGASWSKPVAVGAQVGTMSLSEWWIDGDIGIDSAGNLYAVWDTQSDTNDVGWLSYSTDHGKHWSAPIQAPPDTLNVPHIMEVVGGSAGTAYVSWLSSSDPRGYAEYLRTFSIANGWQSGPAQVSTEFGDTSVWPGDTTGISLLDPSTLVLSWGSATPSTGRYAEIWAAQVGVR
jgi:hypothetical protein